MVYLFTTTQVLLVTFNLSKLQSRGTFSSQCSMGFSLPFLSLPISSVSLIVQLQDTRYLRVHVSPFTFPLQSLFTRLTSDCLRITLVINSVMWSTDHYSYNLTSSLLFSPTFFHFRHPYPIINHRKHLCPFFTLFRYQTSVSTPFLSNMSQSLSPLSWSFSVCTFCLRGFFECQRNFKSSFTLVACPCFQQKYQVYTYFTRKKSLLISSQTISINKSSFIEFDKIPLETNFIIK